MQIFVWIFIYFLMLNFHLLLDVVLVVVVVVIIFWSPSFFPKMTFSVCLFGCFLSGLVAYLLSWHLVQDQEQSLIWFCSFGSWWGRWLTLVRGGSKGCWRRVTGAKRREREGGGGGGGVLLVRLNSLKISCGGVLRTQKLWSLLKRTHSCQKFPLYSLG